MVPSGNTFLIGKPTFIAQTIYTEITRVAADKFRGWTSLLASRFYFSLFSVEEICYKFALLKSQLSYMNLGIYFDYRYYDKHV